MSGTVDGLVRQANQIASFFVTQQPKDNAALRTADHINAYWVARMKSDILDHVDHGGGGLSPVALEAVDIVRSRSAKTVERALHMKGEHSPGHEPGDDAG
jgi:formate dehydrogenase subunit delta